MAADTQGNDIAAVGLPVTGKIAFAPAGTTLPTKTELEAAVFALPVAFKPIGLITVDGGPDWTEESSGDPLEFWQQGYSIPTGLANVTLGFTAAEQQAAVEELAYGDPAAATYAIVDASGNTNSYVFYVEEIYKNGVIRRRVGGNVTVQSHKKVKSTRGEVHGTEFVTKWDYSDAHAGGQFVQAYIQPTPPPAG